MNDSTPKTSWWKRLSSGLKRTSANLGGAIGDLVTKRRLDADTLEELESELIRADLGPAFAGRIITVLREARYEKGIAPDEVRALLAGDIEKVLAPVATPLEITATPFVILVSGVNGSGKTTTIGKLAAKFRADGKKVMLVAGDTFRAAAIEQLVSWGSRLGIEVVRGQYQGDAAALCHDAWNSARRRRIPFLLCDTAGRLHTKSNLMQELAKVKRSLGKLDPTAPHEIFLVADTTTGSNAVVQAKEFHAATPLTGLILTKLDGSGKGGVAVAIARETGVPPRFVGTGESAGDLALFDRAAFLERML
jgi:fused signal recognition particle receptor